MEEEDDFVICEKCVYQESLAAFIREKGARSDCSYCKTFDCCVDDAALSDFMLRKADEVLVTKKQLSFFDWGMVLVGSDTPHVFELWEFFEDYSQYACDEFMEKFVQHIPENHDEKGNKLIYARNDGTLDGLNDFERKWKGFITSIAHQHRFFNREATEFLDSLFQVLLDKDTIDPKLIFPMNYDVPVYRARIASDPDSLRMIRGNPASELGPAPTRFASNQRMSPEGISVFYGALDRDTCISEIRPLVGDALISGEFRVIRGLKLLDLDRLVEFKADVEVFHDDYLKFSHASTFFKELVFQMSRPARRSSGNPYLPTQVIFEYLSVKCRDQVDGIKYRSVQQDQVGECIALFPQSSAVSPDGACPVHVMSDTFDFLGVNPEDHEPTHLELREAHELAGVNYASLFWMPASLKYHRVRGVRYEQREYENDLHFTGTDKILGILRDTL